MIKNLKDLEEFIQNICKENGLDTQVQVTFSNLDNVDIQINSLIAHTKNESFNLIKKQILEKVSNLEIIYEIVITDTGFINMTLDNIFFKYNLLNKPEDIKNQLEIDNKSVLFDYGGANIGKSLHVGHLRTLNIGRSLSNIYKIAGCNAISDIHFGDWGIPIGLILAYIEKESIVIEQLNAEDLEYIYPNAAKLASTDEDFAALVNKIVKLLNSRDEQYLDRWSVVEKVSKQNIKRLLDLLGFKFDFYKGESDVVELIPEFILNLKKNKLIEIDEGALIATDKQDPPAIVVKSDGSYNYLSTDLATVLDREKKDSYDEYVYVVDQRQSKHFEQLFKLVRYFSLSKSKFTHVGFGTINGLDGKPMKTREGGNYKLEDLLNDVKNKLKEKNKDGNTIDILANSVLTFSDLVNSRFKNYIFDLEKFTNINGKSAIYIQYSQVRAKKLLNQTKIKGFFKKFNQNNKQLLIELLKINYYFNLSYSKNEPHHLGEYLYKLCQEFNSFYGSNKIFSEANSEEEISNYLFIVESYISTLEVVFECLGIEPVDSM